MHETLALVHHAGHHPSHPSTSTATASMAGPAAPARLCSRGQFRMSASRPHGNFRVLFCTGLPRTARPLGSSKAGASLTGATAMAGRLLLEGRRRVMVQKLQPQPVWSHSLLPSPRPHAAAWLCEPQPAERRALLAAGGGGKGAAPDSGGGRVRAGHPRGGRKHTGGENARHSVASQLGAASGWGEGLGLCIQTNLFLGPSTIPNLPWLPWSVCPLVQNRGGLLPSQSCWKPP